MNQESNQLKQHYLQVWYHLLCDWLEWPRDRFARFVERFASDLDDKGNPFFYHEHELSWVVALLIPDSLKSNLVISHINKRYHNDYDHFVMNCVYPAILGGPPFGSFGSNYDWGAGKQRMTRLLSEYSSHLPIHPETTNYEVGISNLYES